jgi:hypothetical protein
VCSSNCKRVRNRRMISPAKAGGSCVALSQEEACTGENCQSAVGGSSCVGKCNKAPTGTGCGCDVDCERSASYTRPHAHRELCSHIVLAPRYDDCCSDYVSICKNGGGRLSVTGSCRGLCGGQGSGTCYCDSTCSTSSDCCSDYQAQCNMNMFG